MNNEGIRPQPLERVDLERDAEDLNILGLTRFYNYDFPVHPGLTRLLGLNGLVCHKPRVTAIEIEQHNSPEPLRLHPHLVQHAREEAWAHGILGYITVEHLDRHYAPINSSYSEDIICSGNSIACTLPTFFVNPTGRLLEVVASPTITHISDAQYVPLGNIPENCTFTFTCHGFEIIHDNFELSQSKLSYEFSHKEAHIDYKIIKQENGSQVFSIGMRCNNMSSRRVRHHLASFCLRQLRITSFQIAHYMRNMQIEA